MNPLHEQHTSGIRRYYLLLILVYLVILAIRQLGSSELFYFGGDESRHFLNGVFWRDLIADGGWRSPIEYLRWYYLKYPALSVHQYPPLFYLLEACIFALIGIHVPAVQMTIIAIMGVSLTIWYQSLCRKLSPEIAFFTVIYLLSNPLFLKNFARIMLDSTAVALTLIVLAQLEHWDRSGNRRDLVFALGFLAMMLGIAFKAYFLVFYAGIVMLYRQIRTHSLRTRILLLLAAFSGIFLLFLSFGTIARMTRIPLLYRTFQGANMMNTKKLAKLLSGDLSVLSQFYFLETFGISGILFTAIGFGIITKHNDWRIIRHELLYAVNFLFIFTLCITHFEAVRFHLFLLPVVAMLSGYAFEHVRTLFQGHLKHIVGGVILLVMIWQGISFAPSYAKGYEQAAREIVALNTTYAPILCDAYADGNFIAYVRKYDPQKRQILFRGDKLLFVSVIYYEHIKKINVQQEEDVYRLLQQYGIRYIVVDNLFTEIKPKALLRQMLTNTEKFRHVATYPIETNISFYEQAGLTVYEYLDYATDYSQPLTLDIAVMSTDLSFTIQELQHPFRHPSQ